MPRYVDAHLAAVAHKVSIAQLDRTVEEARVRFDLDEALARQVAAQEGRHSTSRPARSPSTAVSTSTAPLTSPTPWIWRTRSPDVRVTSVPLGWMRRWMCGVPSPWVTWPGVSSRSTWRRRIPRPRPKARQVLLHVHLSEAALAGSGSDLDLARVEETRSFVSADQVRSWCANPDTQVVIKPVIDLADHVHVDAYETPDRLRERQVLLQHTCVFPWCQRRARRADCDHIDPAARGGPTCDCNIAPLCRRHHRAKTHTRWRYDKTDDTSFVWRSPNGLVFGRDHLGTIPLDTLQP